MSILTRPLTYDDLLQMPDDNRRYEIIGGELHVATAPLPDHQRLSGLQYVDFFSFVDPREHGRVYAAPIDVVLGEHDIVEPDSVLVSAHRLDIIGEKFIGGAPDLLMEILPPTTRVRDETVKAQLYARSGVPEFWVVDPIARSIRVFALRDEAYVDTSAGDGFARSLVLPGFAVDIAAHFAKL
jgi:Uma2 family endonuclease